jgi:hypothetical protein
MDEPEGWRELQQKALDETDPQRLIEIVDQLIVLLTAHEKRVAAEGGRINLQSLEAATDDAP